MLDSMKNINNFAKAVYFSKPFFIPRFLYRLVKKLGNTWLTFFIEFI